MILLENKCLNWKCIVLGHESNGSGIFVWFWNGGHISIHKFILSFSEIAMNVCKEFTYLQGCDKE